MATIPYDPNAVAYRDARGCHGKVKFPSKKNARARARLLGGSLDAYKCVLCRGWHIGHGRSRNPHRAPNAPF
ncbi:MAG TPA: hypothetical protein VEC57_15130 [Candidatus Limnocylindrales bacterium]|nr:hypothetical protein [Candidatus Limnocylindrales bacterium]